MGKTKKDFMEERDKVNDIPDLLKQYPLTPDECFNPDDVELKDCPECYGLGIIPDSYPDQDCPDCHGTGQVYMTEQDLANYMENEIIGNAKMMNDE